MRSDGFRIVGMSLGFLSGAWWVFFGVASGIAEKLKPVGILIHATMPGLLIVASAVAAWRWPVAGGVLLIVEGLAVTIGYPLMVWGTRLCNPTTIGFIFVLMALPLLIAGITSVRAAYVAPSQ